MAKITRLDDPNNPYNVKRTPTSAPTPEQQARNKARSDALRAEAERRELRKPEPTQQPKSVAPIMRRANEEYMDARRQKIDGEVERAIKANSLRRK